TSSRTTYSTLGAPGGAFGGSNGAQSGCESRMSTLITPRNGTGMRNTLLVATCGSARPCLARPLSDTPTVDCVSVRDLSSVPHDGRKPPPAASPHGDEFARRLPTGVSGVSVFPPCEPSRSRGPSEDAALLTPGAENCTRIGQRKVHHGG